ncbi:MAG TPA: MFS transporter [Pirellulales bacterium]
MRTDAPADSTERRGSEAEKPPPASGPDAAEHVSWQSRIGLNAANFFLAELTAVVMPFLGDYLKGRQWSETALGVAISLTGLGVFLMQAPAGWMVDRLPHRRGLLAGAALLLGACYGLIPLVLAQPAWIDPLLFIAGVAQAFFVPVLGALALGLVGHEALNQTIGGHQSWNHAGNLMAAVLTMSLVHLFGLTAVFYALAVGSVLAAGSGFLIQEHEVDHPRASGGNRRQGEISFGELIHDRRVWVLLASAGLYHLAGAPVMPFLGAYIKQLGGSHTQVGCLVLIPQAIMIPLALAAGWLCDHWGRKWLFVVACVVLPLRIFLFSLTQDPWQLVAIQCLDGIGTGLYGVVIVAMCADLTRGKGGFNTLSGLIATALAVGGVIGPLGAGLLAARLGYHGFFCVFAGIGVVAAVVFTIWMPETGEPNESDGRKELARESSVAADKPLP